jgi:hypothetical protein
LLVQHGDGLAFQAKISEQLQDGVTTGILRKAISTTLYVPTDISRRTKPSTMNNQPNPTSALEPRLEASQSNDEQFKIMHWAGKYESYLFLTAPSATYERYSRALSKFVSHFPQKRFTFNFLRADLEDYKQARLKEGASGTTTNIELSILRGFWRFMLRMDAPGVMLNPVRGVRVQKDSSKRKLLNETADAPTASQSPA